MNKIRSNSMVLILVKFSVGQPQQAQLILENDNVNMSGTKKAAWKPHFVG